jgi:hypothetical protein
VRNARAGELAGQAGEEIGSLDPLAMVAASLTAAAIGVMAARHVSIALGAVLDVTGTEVHYDVRDASGASTRVIVPFAARPGASAGVAWRF